MADQPQRRASSSFLQLYQGFLLPRSLLMTPSLFTRSLVEPPSWRPLSLPTHPPPSFLTSSLLLLAFLGLSGHHDPVDGRLHPLGLGVEHDGGLAAVDLDRLPYLPHQGASERSHHLELDAILSPILPGWCS